MWSTRWTSKGRLFFTGWPPNLGSAESQVPGDAIHSFFLRGIIQFLNQLSILIQYLNFERRLIVGFVF